MSENIVQFSDRKFIEEQTGQWLIKLDGDEAPSAEELDSLREWLASSPVHRAALGAKTIAAVSLFGMVFFLLFSSGKRLFD